MSDALTQYETSRSGDAGQVIGRFTGVRMFAIPATSVAGLTRHFEPSPTRFWPGSRPGPFRPRATAYKLLPAYPGRPDFSKVTMWYRTPTYREVASEQVNRGILEIDIAGQATRLLHCRQDITAVIEGPDPIDKRAVWKPVGGSNVVLLPTCSMTLSCALDANHINLATWSAQLGATNKTPCQRFAKAAAETLQLVGIHLRKRLTNDDVWLLRVGFLHNPAGWKDAVWSQRFVRAAVKQFVQTWDADKKVFGESAETTTVMMDVPVGDAEVRQTVLAPVDFSKWNTMLSWMGGLS